MDKAYMVQLIDSEIKEKEKDERDFPNDEWMWKGDKERLLKMKEDLKNG